LYLIEIVLALEYGVRAKKGGTAEVKLLPLCGVGSFCLIAKEIICITLPWVRLENWPDMVI
jgi:hypothetical protein